jgi:hypothetical protein
MLKRRSVATYDYRNAAGGCCSRSSVTSLKVSNSADLTAGRLIWNLDGV